MTLLKLANELDEYNEEVLEEQPSRAIHSDQAATFGERIKGGAAIGGLTGAGKGLISGTLTGLGAGKLKGIKGAGLIPSAAVGGAVGGVTGGLVDTVNGGLTGGFSHVIAKRNEQKAMDAGIEENELDRARRNIGTGSAIAGGLTGLYHGGTSALGHKVITGNTAGALGKGLASGLLAGGTVYGSGVAAETMAQRIKNKRIENELAQQ